MNEVLEAILASKKVTTESGIERRLDFNIESAEGEFVQSLIRKHRPRVVLEVGCAYGIASLYIGEALREHGGTKHIIIDPCQHFPYGRGPKTGYEGIGLANLKRAGYSDLVEFYEASSFECLPKLLARDEKIDFAFLDGQHTFDYVLVDFFYVDKLLSVGGIIVFDDLQYPSIRKVCRYVLTNLSYVSTEPKIADTRLQSRMISTLAKVGPIAKAVRPEIRERDGALGIPNRRFMAIQKKAHDLIGEGPNTTRHWEAHNAF
jgi:predicted O-methyltransferase YrrM